MGFIFQTYLRCDTIFNALMSLSMPQFFLPHMMDLTNNEVKFMMTNTNITSPNLYLYHLMICVPISTIHSFINLTKAHSFGLIYDLNPKMYLFLLFLSLGLSKQEKAPFPPCQCHIQVHSLVPSLLPLKHHRSISGSPLKQQLLFFF